MTYLKVPELYFKHDRKVLISEISHGPNRVLDIGCAEGHAGKKLKELGQASFVVGLEINADAAETARQHLDHVICCDIESARMDEPFMSPHSFDYILLGDILEHLRDPWAVLSRLNKYLVPSGKIIVSIPNVRYWEVVLPLLFLGQWEYKPQGVMDITHLRFFTLSSATRLIKGSGYEIKSYKPLISGRLGKLLNIITLGLLKGLLAVQWIIIAQKTTENDTA